MQKKKGYRQKRRNGSPDGGTREQRAEQEGIQCLEGHGLAYLQLLVQKFKGEKAEKGKAGGFARLRPGPPPRPPAGQLELVYPYGVRLKTASRDLSLLAGLVRLY